VYLIALCAFNEISLTQKTKKKIKILNFTILNT